MSLEQKRDAAVEKLLDYLVEKIDKRTAGGSDCANLIKLLNTIGYEYAPPDPAEGSHIIDDLDTCRIADPMSAYDHM